ncbi:hypothetical protein [Pseudonocardia sp. NPDC049635]|uniref:hypothetical protein n=1 Tax=Pseudonocardia sp. NPDC049635 TaxID=3155506 RepID=UPI0033D166FE
MNAVEFAVSVVELPVEAATPLAVVFDQLELFCVDDEPDTARAGIYLGATYTSSQGRGGAVSDGRLPELLAQVAPGATWMAWDDPHEGWLGTVALSAPGLGLWTGQCDGSGEIYLPAAALPDPQTLLSNPAALDRLAVLSGQAWLERVTAGHAALAADPSPGAGFVPSPPPVEAEWDRPSGLIYIDDPVAGTQIVHAPPGPPVGEINEAAARAAETALQRAGWQLMPTAVSGPTWQRAGHATHVAQLHRCPPRTDPAQP